MIFQRKRKLGRAGSGPKIFQCRSFENKQFDPSLSENAATLSILKND
jgi:hypothetical protein